MKRSFNLSFFRRREPMLALGTSVLAVAALVLLRTPDAASATTQPAMMPAGVVLGATLAPVVAPPVIVGTGASRVTLEGPGVTGVFALGQQAVMANGTRELLAELRLEGVEGAGEQVRLPVALSVVLDHSGSMGGEKMVQAREGIISLLERMHDDDYLSVVIYDDQAELLQPLAQVVKLRASLPARMRQVNASGGTIIPQAMQLGAQSLSAAPSSHVRRIVLVSDGQDGSGITLESLTAELSHRANDRVMTSSLGVGTDYNERFMTTVADAGRGNYGFLRQGSELQAFLTRELEESGATVAESLTAHLELPPGVHFVSAHGGLATASATGVDVPLGTLFAGEHRKLVMQFQIDAGALGTASNLGAQLAYTARIPSANMAPQTLRGVVTVNTVATEAEAIATIDDEIHPDALAVVIDARQEEAMLAWQHGERDQAMQIARDNQHRYRSAAAARPSPVYAQRAARMEDDLSALEGLDSQSEAGRSYRLGSGATRRSEAFSW